MRCQSRLSIQTLTFLTCFEPLTLQTLRRSRNSPLCAQHSIFRPYCLICRPVSFSQNPDHVLDPLERSTDRTSALSFFISDSWIVTSSYPSSHWFLVLTP